MNRSLLCFIIIALIFSQPVISSQRLKVVLSEQDFQFAQTLGNFYKMFPEEAKQEFQPGLDLVFQGMSQAAQAGILHQQDVDRIVAMFKGGPNIPDNPVEPNNPNIPQRIKVTFNDNDFAKIQIVADTYNSLPEDQKARMKPIVDAINNALKLAASKGIFDQADVDKIVSMFGTNAPAPAPDEVNPEPDDTIPVTDKPANASENSRLNVDITDSDFTFLEQASGVYSLLPANIKEQIKPILVKAGEVMSMGVQAGILNKDDVDRISSMFGLKNSSHIDSISDLRQLFEYLAYLFDAQNRTERSGTDKQVISIYESIAATGERIGTRLQVILEDADYELINKAADLYKSLPQVVKDKLKPVVENIKQALILAVQQGIINQQDVNKICELFGF